jgi:hypothetical protein
MAVHKRKGTPFWQVVFEFQGQQFRTSTKTTIKGEAEKFERRWRQEVREQLMLGEPAAMDWGLAIARYTSSVIQPNHSGPGRQP